MSGAVGRREALRAAAAVLAATALVGGRTARAARDRSMVTVNFAETAPVPSLSGFLNSIHLPKVPTSMVTPLQPVFWRCNDLQLYDLIHSWGARFEGPLADGWGYPNEGPWTPPYHDFSKWEDYVRSIARRTQDMEILYDIWNEPDSPGSWVGTQDQFNETFTRAVNVLRQELGPETIVGGPSTTRYLPAFIGSLLNHCLVNEVRVDFLSWHELEPWSDIALVADNVRHARRAFVQSDRYALLGLKEIHINEYVGEVDRYRPGELVAFLWFLESGGADAAARACWDGACNDNSIDGLINPRTQEARADWWVHRLYAEGVEARARWQAEEAHVVALPQALPANGRNVQVLLGYYGHEGASEPHVDLRLRLAGVSHVLQGKAARVRVMHLPDAGPTVLPELPVIAERAVHVSGDAIIFDLERLRVHEAAAIMLTEA